MSKSSLALVGLLLVVAYLGQQAQAQRFAPGYCPTVAAHENFDKTKFFGNWIEVEKTPSIFDLMMRCLVVDYSDDQDNTVNVVVRGISLAGLPLTVNGDGLLQDVHRTGFYSIRYGFGVPFQGTLTTIIDTDYDDYAVVYSCTNSLLSGVFHSEYIWVLSRSGKISNPTRQNIYEKLDRLQINRSGLTMSDRATCPTNSSLIARESDNNLAAQLGSASQPAASAVPASGSESSPAGGLSSAPSANLEKVSPEPTQKSVVVPLLYDLPSPVSSASVGANKVKQVSPNSVDSKPSGSGKPASPAQPAGVGKPASGSQPAASAASPSSIPKQQQQQQQASPVQSIAPQAAPSGQQSQQQQQASPQQQQPSLLQKIQPKPASA